MKAKVHYSSGKTREINNIFSVEFDETGRLKIFLDNGGFEIHRAEDKVMVEIVSMFCVFSK